MIKFFLKEILKANFRNKEKKDEEEKRRQEEDTNKVQKRRF
jgi:hypothetical protein